MTAINKIDIDIGRKSGDELLRRNIFAYEQKVHCMFSSSFDALSTPATVIICISIEVGTTNKRSSVKNMTTIRASIDHCDMRALST